MNISDRIKLITEVAEAYKTMHDANPRIGEYDISELHRVADNISRSINQDIKNGLEDSDDILF